MENKGILFSTDSDRSYATVTMEATSEDIFDTINALLDYVGSADEDCLPKGSRSSVCNLIQALIPNRAQMMALEKMQLQNSIKQKGNNPTK
jgi:hypothetical protein